METKFFARTTFRYGDIIFYPGMEWKPTGGKHDTKIIGSRLVRAELVAPEGADDDKKESGNRLDVHVDGNRGSRKRSHGNRHTGMDTNQVDSGDIGT